jgi:hypothetical protein
VPVAWLADSLPPPGWLLGSLPARPAPAVTWLNRGMPRLKSGCPSRVQVHIQVHIQVRATKGRL